MGVIGPELQIAGWIGETLWEERTNFNTWEEFIEWLIHLAGSPFEAEEEIKNVRC